MSYFEFHAEGAGNAGIISQRISLRAQRSLREIFSNQDTTKKRLTTIAWSSAL